jgi:hypothetical protein
MRCSFEEWREFQRPKLIEECPTTRSAMEQQKAR